MSASTMHVPTGILSARSLGVSIDIWRAQHTHQIRSDHLRSSQVENIKRSYQNTASCVVVSDCHLSTCTCDEFGLASCLPYPQDNMPQPIEESWTECKVPGKHATKTYEAGALTWALCFLLNPIFQEPGTKWKRKIPPKEKERRAL